MDLGEDSRSSGRHYCRLQVAAYAYRVAGHRDAFSFCGSMTKKPLTDTEMESNAQQRTAIIYNCRCAWASLVRSNNIDSAMLVYIVLHNARFSSPPQYDFITGCLEGV